MSVRKARFPLLALVVGMTGCDIVDSDCTLALSPGLAVQVVDSISGEPVPVASGAVAATDGDYTESAEGDGPASLWAIFLEGRPGTYRVTVAAPEYAPWMQEGVRVNADRCGIHTTELTARLQPAG
ncbi:hypothetical protein BH23GEM11_BH23GEM11_18930 [soil metagenome]